MASPDISKKLPGAGGLKIPGDQLAFDIDGVVADTMALFVDIARDDYGITDLQYEDIVSYSLDDVLEIDRPVLEAIIQKLLDGDYDKPLLPVAGAPEVLNRLGRLASPILFVTARPYMGPIADWMEAVLDLEASDITIVATGSFEAKLDVLAAHGISYFVEDRLETCEILQAAGITPVLYKQPWNRANQVFVEIDTWQELAEMIDFD